MACRAVPLPLPNAASSPSQKRFYQNKVVYIKAGKQFFAEDA